MKTVPSSVLAITLATVAGSTVADECIPTPPAFFYITYDTDCLECTSSISYASAAAVTTRLGCSDGPPPCDTECGADADVDASGCDTYAYAGAGGDCHDPHPGCVSATAEASHSSGLIFGLVELSFPCCVRASDGSRGQSTGAAGGSAGVYVEFDVDKACDTTVEFFAGDPCTAALPSSGPRNVTAGIAFSSCDTVCISQTQTPNGYLEVGSTCGVGTATLSLCGPTDSIEMITVAFNDQRFDLSGDGRFSQADVDLLFLEVGNPATGALEGFDINGNGTIDIDDVALLQTLIDCGLGSGIFGDTNGDGVANCCDLPDYTAALGSTIGSPAYLIELDFDLDGDIDSVDQAEMNKVCAADFNDDYQLDFFDVTEFLNAYNNADPAADLNGDSNFDFLDVSAFLGEFNAPC